MKLFNLSIGRLVPSNLAFTEADASQIKSIIEAILFFCEGETNDTQICSMTILVILKPKWSSSAMLVAWPLMAWSIHLFPVEVGARGFYARSVMCCFHVLGLHNSLVKSIIKELSRLSVESPFCNWINRNNRDWKSWDHPVPTANCSKFQSLVTLLFCQILLWKPSQHLRLEIKCAGL